jgi:hypothetical protein
MMDLQKIVADLKQERDRLNRAITALSEPDSPGSTKNIRVPTPRPAKMNGRERSGLSPEGRKRLSLAMKRRWAERKRKNP